LFDVAIIHSGFRSVIQTTAFRADCQNMRRYPSLSSRPRAGIQNGAGSRRLDPGINPG
jgi:hypothetical protein